MTTIGLHHSPLKPNPAMAHDAGLASGWSSPQPDPTALVGATVPGQTQIIAIYGKGGIGKSFTLANLSYMLAQQGRKVMLLGCDPKSDTTTLLFGGRACPTIIETSARKKAAGEQVEIGDVCFKRDGVFAMELGGPEVGRGCGGRGIIHGFEILERLGFHDWDFDYVLLDFLGDVVCGGFGLPIARDLCQKVVVVGANDLQSLYVANNVCSAVEYFRRLGGNVGVAGMVINKDDGTGEAPPRASASRSWPPSPPTTRSAARAPAIRSSPAPVTPGPPCSRNWQTTCPWRRRSSPSPWGARPCSGCSAARAPVRAWSWNRPPPPTCVPRPPRPSRPWRSSTTSPE